MRDSNLLDAWKSGGEFEGKKVTDDDVVNHWKARRDEVGDPADPQWDYYNNLYLTYGYSIRESKMSLKYAEKKVSDTQMAAFYREEAAKMDPNSEVYRTLMKNAAQFVDRARSAAAAGAAKAKAEAWARADRAQRIKGAEPVYDWMVTTLTQAARDSNILTAKEKLGELQVMEDNDPVRMMMLIDQINESLTAKDIAELKKADPAFVGFTYEYVSDLFRRKVESANTRADMATANGYKGEANKAKKEADGALTLGITVNSLDELVAYNTGRNQYDIDMGNAKSALERDSIRQNYIKNVLNPILGKLPESKTLPDGTVVPGSQFRGPINGELASNMGESPGFGNSLMEDTSNQTKADTKELGDLEAISILANEDKAAVEAIRSGKAQFVQGEWAWDEFNNRRIFQPTSGGSQWGTTLDMENAKIDVNAVLTSGRMTKVTVRNPDGTLTMAYVPVSPIQVTPVGTPDPTTGMQSSEGVTVVRGASGTVGQMATLPDGTTLYGVYQKGQGGKMAWSYLPPWNKELVTGTPYVDQTGTLQVTMNAPAPSTDPTLHSAWVGADSLRRPADPMNAVSAVASDPGLQNTHRWNSTLVTEFMSSASKREELLSVKPEAMWTFLYQNSATPEEAVSTFGEYQRASEDAFYGPSYAARRAAVEANLPSWLPDERDAVLDRASNQASSGVLAAVARGDLNIENRQRRDIPTWDTPLSEEAARRRAQSQIDAFNPSGMAGRPRPDISKVPVLKLPGIVEQWTGQAVNWQVAPPAADWGKRFEDALTKAPTPPPPVPTPAAVAPPPTAGGTKPGVLPVPGVTPLKTPALPPSPSRIYEPPPPPPITPFSPRSDIRIRL
jgi:hypothetical protein